MATGHIKKRTTKTGTSYQLIVEDERDATTGKRNRHYKTIKGTKKQAEIELRKFITEVENGGVCITSSVKVKDWIPEWINTYKKDLEETTRASYIHEFEKHIKNELGDIPINKLHPCRVQQWVNDLTEVDGLSPRSVKNIYQCLSSSMKKAKQLKLVTENPCDCITLPKRSKYYAKVYNGAEIQNAMALAKDTDTDMYTILLLGAGLGLRRGEMTALKWEHIDFDNKTINVQENAVAANGKVIVKKPKTQSSIRKISIGNNMVEELKIIRQRYRKAKFALGRAFVDSGCVLFKDNGEMFSPYTVTKKWKKFLKKNNLNDIRLHDLRHSSATALLEQGVNMKTIQEILGHADFSTTSNIYSHVTEKMNKEAAKTMDDILFA